MSPGGSRALDDNVVYREQLHGCGTVTEDRVLLVCMWEVLFWARARGARRRASGQGWHVFDAHRQGVSRETSSLGLLSPEHAQGHASLLVIMSTKVTVDHGRKSSSSVDLGPTPSMSTSLR